MLNNNGLVQAGTVNRLIEHLTSSKIHDLTFMKTFLLTYQAFITPKIFFSKLEQRYPFYFIISLLIIYLSSRFSDRDRYHVPAPETTDIGNFVENVQRPIQLRMSFLLFFVVVCLFLLCVFLVFSCFLTYYRCL